MSIGSALFYEWFTRPELERLNSNLEWQQQRDQQQDARIEELRADLERMSLLAKTLAELCIERGVLTREQLHDRMLAHDPRRAASPYQNRRA
jgi:hypothetical protein